MIKIPILYSFTIQLVYCSLVVLNTTYVAPIIGHDKGLNNLSGQLVFVTSTTSLSGKIVLTDNWQNSDKVISNLQDKGAIACIFGNNALWTPGGLLRFSWEPSDRRIPVAQLSFDDFGEIKKIISKAKNNTIMAILDDTSPNEWNIIFSELLVVFQAIVCILTFIEVLFSLTLSYFWSSVKKCSRSLLVSWILHLVSCFQRLFFGISFNLQIMNSTGFGANTITQPLGFSSYLIASLWVYSLTSKRFEQIGKIPMELKLGLIVWAIFQITAQTCIIISREFSGTDPVLNDLSRWLSLVLTALYSLILGVFHLGLTYYIYKQTENKDFPGALLMRSLSKKIFAMGICELVGLVLTIVQHIYRYKPMGYCITWFLFLECVNVGGFALVWMCFEHTKGNIKIL